MSNEDDPLLQSLRDLPAHRAPPHGDRVARAAYTATFAPWPLRTLGLVSRGLVPVALASIVGLYLTWAFAAAIALNN